MHKSFFDFVLEFADISEFFSFDGGSADMDSHSASAQLEEDELSQPKHLWHL
jgi:hypothetical protein